MKVIKTIKNMSFNQRTNISGFLHRNMNSRAKTKGYLFREIIPKNKTCSFFGGTMKIQEKENTIHSKRNV